MFDPRTERPVGPVVVFFHGGGFCVGSITSHAALAAEISRQLDLPVISVEYRLAPEHPWPAAPDDAEAAARWIAENGDVFGRTFDGLILCGDSAGGNLALVTALAFREAPANAPLVQQLTLYPGTDTGSDRESRQKFSQNYGLDGEDMTLFEQHYAGDSADWRHSPLKADLTGLAPTVLITAALDPLRDEGRAFEDVLAEAQALGYAESDAHSVRLRRGFQGNSGRYSRICDFSEGHSFGSTGPDRHSGSVANAP